MAVWCAGSGWSGSRRAASGCLERRDRNATLRGRGDGAAILATTPWLARVPSGGRVATCAFEAAQLDSPFRLRYPHLSPDRFRGEITRTERPDAVEPDAVTGPRRGGEDAPEVAESMYEHRGSSVAEQLIRNEPQAPPRRTQHDINPGNQTQQP
jgi:hypothetical protein